MKKIAIFTSLILLSQTSFAEVITAKKGDTLYSLSKNNGMTVSELLDCNKLSTDYILKENDQLQICEKPSVLASIKEDIVEELKETVKDETKKELQSIKEKSLSSLIPENPTEKITFAMPLENGKIISSFGKQTNGLYNDGINFAPTSSKKVLASRNGIVLYITDEVKGLGNTVILKHDYDYITIYSHLSKIDTHVGQTLKTGDKIGLTGTTGKFKEEQVHFEIRKNLKPLNPKNLLSN